VFVPCKLFQTSVSIALAYLAHSLKSFKENEVLWIRPHEPG